MNEERSNRVLLSFVNPDVLDKPTLRRMLLDLNVIEIKKLKTVDSPEIEFFDLADDCTIDLAVSALHKSILEDFETNKSESIDASWSFDYQVQVIDPDDTGLCILTRIFTDAPQSGGSSYGRTARRVGESRFLVWIYDD